MPNLNLIEIVKINEDIYYLNIKAKSFLHNMFRKIFWIIENYSLGNIYDEMLKNICNNEKECGTGLPENLVFCCAYFNIPIEWVVNRKNKEKRKNILEAKIIEFETNNFIFRD